METLLSHSGTFKHCNDSNPVAVFYRYVTNGHCLWKVFRGLLLQLILCTGWVRNSPGMRKRTDCVLPRLCWARHGVWLLRGCWRCVFLLCTIDFNCTTLTYNIYDRSPDGSLVHFLVRQITTSLDFKLTRYNFLSQVRRSGHSSQNSSVCTRCVWENWRNLSPGEPTPLTLPNYSLHPSIHLMHRR